jgi:hypothetical protein
MTAAMCPPRCVQLESALLFTPEPELEMKATLLPVENVFGTQFRNYTENKTERQRAVEQFYKTNHENQTYDFVQSQVRITFANSRTNSIRFVSTCEVIRVSIVRKSRSKCQLCQLSASLVNCPQVSTSEVSIVSRRSSQEPKTKYALT